MPQTENAGESDTPPWTVDSLLAHLESSGTFTDRKLLRTLRRLIEAEREARPKSPG